MNRTPILHPMNYVRRAGLALSACAVSAASGQMFTGGNLVVSRVDITVSGGPSHASKMVTLVEYTPTGLESGAYVVLPVGGSSSTWACTLSGNDATEGQLNLSDGGLYLTMAGYDAPPGAIHVSTTWSSARVVALVDENGMVGTTLVDFSWGPHPIRSAVASLNGDEFWIVGDTLDGVFYQPTASGSTAQFISASPTSPRNVNILGASQLYAGGPAANSAVMTVGVGTPSTAGQVASVLSGMAGASVSTSDFYLTGDGLTLYIADDRALSSSGGLQVWTLSSGSWTYSKTITAGLQVGLRGLTGRVGSDGKATLYATTAEAAETANDLVWVKDDGTNPSFAVLATAPPGSVFRGVDFSPGPVLPLTGRCCLPSGVCQITTLFGCTALQGVYGGNGSLCGVCVPTVCYANCDLSTTPPKLNVNDFACFLNKFAAGDSYANCDSSTTPNVLNILDFACFINRYAAGCP